MRLWRGGMIAGVAALLILGGWGLAALLGTPHPDLGGSIHVVVDGPLPTPESTPTPSIPPPPPTSGDDGGAGVVPVPPPVPAGDDDDDDDGDVGDDDGDDVE